MTQYIPATPLPKTKNNLLPSNPTVESRHPKIYETIMTKIASPHHPNLDVLEPTPLTEVSLTPLFLPLQELTTQTSDIIVTLKVWANCSISTGRPERGLDVYFDGTSSMSPPIAYCFIASLTVISREVFPLPLNTRIQNILLRNTNKYLRVPTKQVV